MTLINQLPAVLLCATCLAVFPVAISAADAPTSAPAAVPTVAPPSPAAVVNMINNCFSCHGTDGRSPGAIPSLTGMKAEQALLVLKEFKSGARSGFVMTRLTKGYTDAELESLANYIANNLK
jgi:sulfide dehydrogenase cytochrome subunit